MEKKQKQPSLTVTTSTHVTIVSYFWYREGFRAVIRARHEQHDGMTVADFLCWFVVMNQ